MLSSEMRRLFLWGAVLVLAGVLGLLWLRSAGESIDPWTETLAEISENGMSRELAVEAFALSFGPVPGVDIAQGASNPHSGSGPLRWVIGYWDDLTSEQRQMVEDVYVRGLEPETAAGRRVNAVHASYRATDRRVEAQTRQDLDALSARFESVVARAGAALEKLSLIHI